MTVFRGDSGNDEAIEPKEGREASGSAQVDGAPETGAPGARKPGVKPRTGGSGTGAPTASAMRRALARARDGKPLDVDEATVLLHARGEDLDSLLAYAGRTRDAGLEAAGRPRSSRTRARSSSR